MAPWLSMVQGNAKYMYISKFIAYICNLNPTIHVYEKEKPIAFIFKLGTQRLNLTEVAHTKHIKYSIT